MNFNQIIKEEWEKEFPYQGIQGSPEEPETYEHVFEESIFYNSYQALIERICVRVWNSALELAADAAETEHSFEQVEDFPDAEFVVFVNKNSILNLKLDEQGTDTTEV